MQHDDGNVVYFPALRGCHTWGHTYEEAVSRASEALVGQIEALQKNGEAIPQEEERSPVSLGLVIDVPMLVSATGCRRARRGMLIACSCAWVSPQLTRKAATATTVTHSPERLRLAFPCIRATCRAGCSRKSFATQGSPRTNFAQCYDCPFHTLSLPRLRQPDNRSILP